MYQNGILYVKDLFDMHWQMLKYGELCELYGDCCTVMQFNSIISSLPQEWKKKMKSLSEITEDELDAVENCFDSLREKTKMVIQHLQCNNT